MWVLLKGSSQGYAWVSSDFQGLDDQSVCLLEVSSTAGCVGRMERRSTPEGSMDEWTGQAEVVSLREGSKMDEEKNNPNEMSSQTQEGWRGSPLPATSLLTSQVSRWGLHELPSDFGRWQSCYTKTYVGHQATFIPNGSTQKNSHCITPNFSEQAP